MTDAYMRDKMRETLEIRRATEVHIKISQEMCALTNQQNRNKKSQNTRKKINTFKSNYVRKIIFFKHFCY